MDKRQALRELAVRRKQTPPPEGSFRLGKYHEGIYDDGTHVSPYTKGARIMLMPRFLCCCRIGVPMMK